MTFGSITDDIKTQDSIADNSITQSVRDQYEQQPYPFRKPEDELTRIISTVGDTLEELNHYCFNGNQDFNNNFRCLVAGGGTGDSAIFLAEQLKNKNATITYLDMSSNSRKIAEERARIRGLTNIEWITGRLQDIAKLNLGTFDYINCSGVLHHLEDPQEGLSLLKSALKPNGAIFLMIYGKHARAAIYQMQALLKSACSQITTLNEKIELTRQLLDELPSGCLFSRSLDLWKNEIDFKQHGDAGLVDLLLHASDVAYDRKELGQFVELSGLEFVDFTGQFKRFYELDQLIKNKTLLIQMQQLPLMEQQAMAEIIHGGIIKHQFYLTQEKNTQASINDLDNMVTLAFELKGQHMALHNAMQVNEILNLNYTLENKTEIFSIRGTQTLKTLFRYFDGKTTLKEALTKTRQRHKTTTDKKLLTELQSVFDLFHVMGWMFLSKAKI